MLRNYVRNLTGFSPLDLKRIQQKEHFLKLLCLFLHHNGHFLRLIQEVQAAYIFLPFENPLPGNTCQMTHTGHTKTFLFPSYKLMRILPFLYHFSPHSSYRYHHSRTLFTVTQNLCFSPMSDNWVIAKSTLTFLGLILCLGPKYNLAVKGKAKKGLQSSVSLLPLRISVFSPYFSQEEEG